MPLSSSVHRPRRTPRPRRPLARRLGLLTALVGLVVTALAAPGQAVAAPHTVTPAAVATAPAAPLPGAYTAVTPTRVLDTRTGLGAPKAALPVRGSVSVLVAGTSGVPTTGVGAVATTMTVTDTAGAGYLTAYPSGGTRPTTSTLNWTKGLTIANTAILPVGPDGRVVLYNGSTGSTDAVVDVEGWYAAGASTDPGSYQPIAPTRILDTRYGIGGPKGQIVHSYDCADLTSAVKNGPAAGAQALVVNVTVTNALRPGALSAGDRSSPWVIRWSTGETTAHLAVVSIENGGYGLCMTEPGPVDVVVDLVGTVEPGAAGTVGRSVVMESPQPVLGVNPWSTPPRGGSVTFAPATPTPPAGQVSALALEVTVDPTQTGYGGGYLTGGATGGPPSGTSLMNWTGRRVDSQLVVLPVGADGTVTLTFSAGSTAALSVALVSVVLAATPVVSTRWGSPQTVPMTGGITSRAGLSCAAGGVCGASFVDGADSAGGQGLARRDGGAWHVATLSFPRQSGSPLVACAGSGLCVVTSAAPGGSQPQVPFAADSTPSRDWTATALPVPASTTALRVTATACASTGTTCWAVGQITAPDPTTHVAEPAPYAAVRDAAGWREVDVPIEPGGANGGLTGVACRSDDDCLVVGAQTAQGEGDPVDLVDHWDGTSWSDVLPAALDTGGRHLLNQPAPTSDGYVVTSAHGSVTHWTGRTWTFGPTRATAAAACLTTQPTCVAPSGSTLLAEPSDTTVPVSPADPFAVPAAIRAVSCGGATCVAPVLRALAPQGWKPVVARLQDGVWATETLPVGAGLPVYGSFAYTASTSPTVACWDTDHCIAMGGMERIGPTGSLVGSLAEWDLTPAS